MNVGQIETNKGELLFYLEEMMSMGLSDEIEDAVYYDIKYGGTCKRGGYLHALNNMKLWENEKF